MFKFFKNLLAAKISITIINPAKDVKRITVPTRIECNHINVIRRTQSNLRFVEDRTTTYDGKETVWWATEEYCSGRWRNISSSISCRKSIAMKLHLLIAETGNIDSVNQKIILWEGLDIDEATSWVTLNDTYTN